MEIFNAFRGHGVAGLDVCNKKEIARERKEAAKRATWLTIAEGKTAMQSQMQAELAAVDHKRQVEADRDRRAVQLAVEAAQEATRAAEYDRLCNSLPDVGETLAPFDDTPYVIHIVAGKSRGTLAAFACVQITPGTLERLPRRVLAFNGRISGLRLFLDIQSVQSLREHPRYVQAARLLSDGEEAASIYACIDETRPIQIIKHATGNKAVYGKFAAV